MLRILCEKVNVEQFFLFNNNINFYKKVQNQRVHNKNYWVVYTAKYVCFMKDQGSFFCHIVDYKVINKLTLPDFLLTPIEF